MSDHEGTEVTCPVCRSGEHERVLSLAQLPVLINAQVSADAAPNVPRGDIDLVVCRSCAHLFNRSFDEQLLDYDATYENTLHFSNQFQDFASGLAQRLVDDHSLRGADIGELGSGPGHFLSMLCDAGAGRAVGWDPSYDPDRLGAPEHPLVTVSTDLFPADGSVPMQLAFSQHVLEHLHDPVGALAAQRAAVVGSGGVVYSEVPNGRLMVDHGALWDLIYEHLSYFMPCSLDTACRRAGLRIDSSGSAFGDQFLWCEASAVDVEPDALPAADVVASSVEAARSFGVIAERRIESARNDLASYARSGPVALWGAGSKGATYLNLVSDVAEVAGVIDINPRKAGWGVPGTSLTVSQPEALRETRPRTVLAANPIYLDEIGAMLDAMSVDAQVLPLWT